MNQRIPNIALPLVCALACLSSCTDTTPGVQSANEQLVTRELVTERLGHMRSVAAYKWVHDLPVEDLAREQVVIDGARQAARRHNVTEASAVRFIKAQIDAAKQIQHCWHSRWREGKAPASAPDLNREVRPALIRLGNEIMASLPQGRQHALNAEELASQVDCLDQASAERIQQALASIETHESHLARILATGALRVGATFDYPPFTYTTEGKQRAGIDIDMAEDFANSLGVRLIWVATSWPTLTPDLASAKFDMAVGGVSRTDDRAKVGHFSTSYHIGGKTPIIRCEDHARLQTMDQIDSAGIKVIVNPGGTNERYVDANIRHATKVLHDDNRTIFDALASGEADVMITDEIEVRWQTARQGQLCAAMPGTRLTHQEKSYFMLPDDRLRDAVDQWLTERTKDGTLSATFSRHLSPR